MFKNLLYSINPLKRNTFSEDNLYEQLNSMLTHYHKHGELPLSRLRDLIVSAIQIYGEEEGSQKCKEIIDSYYNSLILAKETEDANIIKLALRSLCGYCPEVYD